MDWHWQQLATARTTRQAHVRDTPPARGPTRTGPVLLPSPRPRWEVTVLGLDSYATYPTGRPTQRGRAGPEFPHPTRAGPAPAGNKHLIAASSGPDRASNTCWATTRLLLPVMFTRPTTGGITTETVNCALTHRHIKGEIRTRNRGNKASASALAGSEFLIPAFTSCLAPFHPPYSRCVGVASTSLHIT